MTFQIMKHASLAGLADKVTRKEQFHITIKKKHSCLETLLVHFCFSGKGSLPPFGKKAKGIIYRLQN
jgi:hypothetical protein